MVKHFAPSIFVLMTIAALSCKEQLPEYRDPLDLFDATFSGAYVISPSENAIRAYMKIVNRYDETLDAQAILNGRLVITWAGDVSFKKTVTLGAANLLYARGFNPLTGVLRFDSGDSIRIGYAWNLISDDGRSLLNLVPMMPDPTCPIRHISTAPVPLFFEGSIVIYDRTGTVTPKSFRYEFTLVLEFVDPRSC